jgi:hypothetical protein
VGLGGGVGPAPPPPPTPPVGHVKTVVKPSFSSRAW